jgi:proteasome lid subunit RPN8/RPN11
MTLYMAQCAKDSITHHGEGGYPNEICGVLLGKDVDSRRTIRTMVPVENSFEAGEQFHRFLITPETMFEAEKLARLDKLDIVGVYHSHPNAPAHPSEYDRDHAAWTGWSYIIVSVKDGKVDDLRAWKLRDDRSAFDEEDVVVE